MEGSRPVNITHGVTDLKTAGGVRMQPQIPQWQLRQQ
jgi:hypothetical protein